MEEIKNKEDLLPRYNDHALIFEIYLSNKNSPNTNIELPEDWSLHPIENEVLLLPYFGFQVTQIQEKQFSRDEDFDFPLSHK